MFLKERSSTWASDEEWLQYLLAVFSGLKTHKIICSDSNSLLVILWASHSDSTPDIQIEIQQTRYRINMTGQLPAAFLLQNHARKKRGGDGFINSKVSRRHEKQEETERKQPHYDSDTL